MTGSKSADIGDRNQDSIFSEVTSIFTSVRTTIVVLCVLAVASIFGTIIPQNVDLDQFRRVASPFYYRLVVILDLHNVYRSWWFILLLLLLTGNLLGCLLQRLPRIPGEWKGVGKKGTIRFTLSDARPKDQVRAILAPVLGKLMGSSPSVVEDAKSTILIWVRHRVFLLAFPLIHAAIIAILLGGVVGLFYGVRGNIVIEEGEAGQDFVRYPSGDADTLPFSIAVDKFTLKRYPTGQPKEYRSDVRLLKNGEQVAEGSILVNQPLTYEGISLYQANYQLIGVKLVTLRVVDEQGKTAELVVRPPESARLPGTDYTIGIHSVDPGSTTRGPGADLNVVKTGEAPKRASVFRDDSAALQLDGVKITFGNYEPLYTTGLQIGYDPGTNIVWFGCGLLVIGFCLTLFTNLRSVTASLTSEAGKTTIVISGRSRRNRAEFRETIENEVRGSLEKS
ncbi:MAG: cytochrome c biogenesis protein ResB [Desulfomonilaceae bacterium]|nr:cytochrome c biogenesis protein ResB [Desulfomonilaceae bacterium]